MSRHQKGKVSSRQLRLSDQIQKDLAIMIQRELDMSRVGLITLSGLELTPDYAHAKVYFTVLGAAPDTALQALTEKAGWFHSLLYKRLHIHTVPTLHFIHDKRMSEGLALSELISTANQPGVKADDVPDAVQVSDFLDQKPRT